MILCFFLSFSCFILESGSQYVAQAVLNSRCNSAYMNSPHPPASTSPMLELQVCAIHPTQGPFILHCWGLNTVSPAHQYHISRLSLNQTPRLHFLFLKAFDYIFTFLGSSLTCQTCKRKPESDMVSHTSISTNISNIKCILYYLLKIREAYHQVTNLQYPWMWNSLYQCIYIFNL